MPRTVKAFVWIGALYVLFGAGLLAWNIHAVLQTVAALHMAPQAREALEDQMLVHAVRVFAVHTVIFVVLAGLVALGRQNWARWLLACYFAFTVIDPLPRDAVLYLSSPKLFHFAYGDIGAWWQHYLNVHWLEPPSQGWPHYASLAFWVVLLALIFSPTARPWFGNDA